MILIGTGSEVQLAVAGARRMLAEKGIRARVVSMPCREWFDRQEQSYRDTVLPPIVKARVSVEAGIAMSWRDLVGSTGRMRLPRALRRVGRLRDDLPRVRNHRRGRGVGCRGQHRRLAAAEPAATTPTRIRDTREEPDVRSTQGSC